LRHSVSTDALDTVYDRCCLLGCYGFVKSETTARISIHVTRDTGFGKDWTDTVLKVSDFVRIKRDGWRLRPAASGCGKPDNECEHQY
jgi:hypothetical protein